MRIFFFFLALVLMNNFLLAEYRDCNSPAQVLEYETKLVENFKDQNSEAFLVEQSALKCNSLKGYSRILLAPQYSISNPKSRVKVEERLVSQLEKIGKVIRLPMNDVTGLGNTEGILVFDIQPMHTIDGKLLSNSLGSLSYFTSASGTKSPCGKVEAWTAQGISNGVVKKDHAEDYLHLLEPLLLQFTKDYQSENKGKPPLFYLYSSSEM